MAGESARPTSILSGRGEEVGAQVAFAGAGQDHDDEFAPVFGAAGHRQGGKDRGPGRDAAENPFQFGHVPGGLEGRLVAHRDDFIDDFGVQDLGDEAGADALNLVGAGLAAGEHRRGRRLHGHGLERRACGP